MKKDVVFRNLRTFSTEKLLKYLRKHIRINVRMKISVGTYGKLGEEGRKIQSNSVNQNSVKFFSVNFYKN